jgi:hypothetical protein
MPSSENLLLLVEDRGWLDQSRGRVVMVDRAAPANDVKATPI